MSRKSFLTILAILVTFVVLVLPVKVAAQSSIEGLSQTEESKPIIQDVEGLRLEIVQRIQDPSTMDVQFDLINKRSTSLKGFLRLECIIEIDKLRYCNAAMNHSF